MKGRFDEIYPAADVCVIGGGPAGMAAALAAAGQGLRVILLEARPRLGGAFEYRAATDRDGTAAVRTRGRARRQVESAPNIRVFAHAPAIGVYTDGQVTAFQRGGPEGSFDERYIEIRARGVVVASGCIERPLLFENNERPGVMQAECALRLARTWGILPGREAVFSVGHDQGLEAAIDLSDLGLKVAAVADAREDGQAPRLIEALGAAPHPRPEGLGRAESPRLHAALQGDALVAERTLQPPAALRPARGVSRAHPRDRPAHPGGSRSSPTTATPAFSCRARSRPGSSRPAACWA